MALVTPSGGQPYVNLGSEGGGIGISFDTLITAMLEDYPNHLELLSIVRNPRGGGGTSASE